MAPPNPTRKRGPTADADVLAQEQDGEQGAEERAPGTQSR